MYRRGPFETLRDEVRAQAIEARLLTIVQRRSDVFLAGWPKIAVQWDPLPGGTNVISVRLVTSSFSTQTRQTTDSRVSFHAALVTLSELSSEIDVS